MENEWGNFALYILQISAFVIANVLQPCQISKFNGAKLSEVYSLPDAIVRPFCNSMTSI